MNSKTKPDAALPWSGSVAQMLFLQSPFSSVLFDPNGHILAANGAFTRYWGVDVAKAPPGYCVLTDPELEGQGVLPEVARAFAGEAVVTPPVRYDISRLSTSGEGKVRWTQGHFHPLLNEHGQVQYVVLTHIDLTERMESEVKLRHALADLQTLQDLTAALATANTKAEVAAVALERARPAFGADGGFVTIVEGDDFVVVRQEGFAAASFTPWQHFSTSSETASGHAYRTGEPVFVSSVDELERMFPAAASAVQESGYRSFAALPLHADNRVIGVLLFHFKVEQALNLEQRETLIAFAGQCSLAMERALLYESERKARAEAEAASYAKSEFLARMSHELRTPLNAIDGYAELLELGIRGPLNDAQHADMQRIRRSQKHLLSLIDDILSFARIESGVVYIQLESVTLSEAVSAAYENVAPQIAAKGLWFRDDCDAGLQVTADSGKLQQVLANLLTNAVKFTERGGVTLSARAEADHVSIEVADTGIGIPADRLASIFEPFVQIDIGTTRRNTGTGLGLTIARDFAQRMGGDITVASTLGKGTTFTVTLPLAS